LEKFDGDVDINRDLESIRGYKSFCHGSVYVMSCKEITELLSFIKKLRVN
jgi:hypothetical protein